MVATAAPPRRQRRVKLKSNSSTVGEYRYDALGRRVEKVVTGATYRYVYSGVETVSVYTSTGTWKQDYVYGPGIDEVLMLEQADVLDADGDTNTSETTRSWYLSNALGSVMEVLEQDKTEAASYRYDPYGNLTITRGGASQSSDPLGQYVTYTGRWRDEETGLYHYRARAYDPVRGRFLQRDPLGYSEGPNLFAYVGSSPVTYADPLGTDNPGCDLPGGLSTTDPCELRCCAAHDRCYHENGCTALSWLLGSPACQVCNTAVALCFFFCNLIPSWNGPSVPGPYYDDDTCSFYDDLADIPDAPERAKKEGWPVGPRPPERLHPDPDGNYPWGPPWAWHPPYLPPAGAPHPAPPVPPLVR